MKKIILVSLLYQPILPIQGEKKISLIQKQRKISHQAIQIGKFHQLYIYISHQLILISPANPEGKKNHKQIQEEKKIK